MLLNCYYYAPHNHTLLASHLRRDLEHIASMGTDIVSFCIQEEQLSNWHQQRVRNVVNMIHDCGMKAHAVPNRWAGLVAGWLDGFGRFSMNNRDTLIQPIGESTMRWEEMVSCIHNPKTVEHIAKTTRELFENYAFDGLIWDEPHAMACGCRYCRERCEGEPTEEWYHQRFAKYLDEVSALIKRLRPEAVVSLFVQPFQRLMLETFLDKPNIDYLGSDGHVRHPDHRMHRMKRTIFEAHAEFAPLLEQAGKPSFFLLEAQRHRDEDLENYLENLERAFALKADHLMYYYSAHEMSWQNEQRFNEATWECVAALKNSQPLTEQSS